MLKEGALDGIQGIFGLHVSPEMPTGTIGSRPGPFLAGAGRFLVTVQGKGGHAAAPHLTADPILAACSVILSLQQIVSRETNPLEARVCICLEKNGNLYIRLLDSLACFVCLLHQSLSGT